MDLFLSNFERVTYSNSWLYKYDTNSKQQQLSYFDIIFAT